MKQGKLSFGNSSTDGEFNDEEAVNDGIEKHDIYNEEVDRDEDDNPTQDIDDFFEDREKQDQ